MKIRTIFGPISSKKSGSGPKSGKNGPNGSIEHELRLFIFKRTYLLYILPLEWPEVVPLVDVEVVHLLVGLDFLSVPDKVVVCVQAEQ